MKFSGQFQIDNRVRLIIKIGLILVPAVASLMLYLSNRDLVKHNKKMLKFINNEASMHQNLEDLQLGEKKFQKHILNLKAGADLEKIKGDQINKLLGMVNNKNLKVDSYRSEIEKKDGFVIFKFNITIVGDFVEAVRLFSRIRNEATLYNIFRYTIHRHQERMVRLGMVVEVIGLEG